MPAPQDSGPIRTHGVPERRPPRPPGRRVLVLVGALLIGAAIGAWVAADPSTESERSAITSPTVTDAVVTVTAPLVADEPVADPLDRRVPGMEGTLVLTVGTSAGTEVWRWSTGPDGVLVRSAPAPDTYDARPAPDGSAVAAIHRYGRELPKLLLGASTPTVPIFLGADGFAWSGSDVGALVWLEQSTDPDVPTIHLGQWTGDGVFFKPVGTMPGHDVTRVAGIPDRLVAFDLHGLVVERVDGATPAADVTTERIALDGTVLAAVDGFYVGSSADGLVAITSDGRTRVFAGPTLEQRGEFATTYDSVRWAADGRMAATAREGTTIDLIDGSATRTVEVGDVGPSVLTWSADGRFVVASGHVADEPILVFIDSATLDTTTVLLSGHPVAAVSIP